MKKMPIEKTEPKNEIVVYQPDEVMRLEVRVLDESVWLTQAQIAELFGTKRPAITKHLTNIYKTGELERDGTCSILEHMGHDGVQQYRTAYYNLDAILAVGYRVNSREATQFRRWASSLPRMRPFGRSSRSRRGGSSSLTITDDDTPSFVCS